MNNNILKNLSLRVMSVTNCDINNGPGFRMTVWVAGCSHNCSGCHNRHTHRYDQGKVIWSKDDNGNSVQDQILDTFYKYRDHLDGITISGGDPLDQTDSALEDLMSFLDKFKMQFPCKTIWLYTGCVWEDLTPNQRLVADRCDVIVDGKFEYLNHDGRLPFRGSSNQRIIDVDKTIINKGVPVIIDDEEFKK